MHKVELHLRGARRLRIRMPCHKSVSLVGVVGLDRRVLGAGAGTKLGIDGCSGLAGSLYARGLLSCHQSANFLLDSAVLQKTVVGDTGGQLMRTAISVTLGAVKLYSCVE